LLEVIDASDPVWQMHVGIVQEILEELEVEKPIIYVFNKIDLLTEEQQKTLEKSATRYQPHVFISAKTKKGIKPLINYLSEWKVQ